VLTITKSDHQCKRDETWGTSYFCYSGRDTWIKLIHLSEKSLDIVYVWDYIIKDDLNKIITTIQTTSNLAQRSSNININKLLSSSQSLRTLPLPINVSHIPPPWTSFTSIFYFPLYSGRFFNPPIINFNISHHIFFLSPNLLPHGSTFRIYIYPFNPINSCILFH